VTQQSRNLTWKLEEEGIELSVVLHDRDLTPENWST